MQPFFVIGVLDEMKPTALTNILSAVIYSAALAILAAPIALSQKQTASSPQARHSRQSVVTQKEYLHLVKIQQGINQSQRLSDADVTFLVSELNSLSPQSISLNQLMAANLVLAHTYGIKPKITTLSQRHRLYDAIVPYTYIPDSATEVNASLALASTRDPRAVARLENLAWSSPYPVVRLSANNFLMQLQKVLTPRKSKT